jgi:glycosyltransferase involved in cell wall biosynthesis
VRQAKYMNVECKSLDAPLISVILPVYNAEKYLEEAVESILVQTLTEFEFIIINDGSSDKSSEIIDSYKKRDKRITVIERENKGHCKFE